MKSSNFDIAQYYLIKFTKEKLHKKYTFIQFYKNFLAVIIYKLNFSKILIIFKINFYPLKIQN